MKRSCILLLLAAGAASAAPSPITNNARWTNDRPVALPDATRPRVESVFLYQPSTEWTYSHHQSITFFKGRFHAIWSNGRQDEDAPGQRVLTSSSPDFRTWTTPRPLVDSVKDEAGVERVLTAAGFHQHAGTLVAYFGNYGPNKETTHLQAVTTTDGERWSAPREIGLPINPNHPPQRTASGRLILAGNISFPYTDDPAGLTGWRMTGIYPPDMAATIKDDPASFWDVARRQGWSAALCEGSFYQTDDGVLHMLLRNTGKPQRWRLWVTESRDDGVTWSSPVETAFSDTNAKFHFGRLPDGRFYYVGNPIGGGRTPLVLSLSRDGVTFDRHHILGEARYESRRAGRWKGGEYGYPHSLVHDGALHVIVSRQKEAVEVLRVSLEELDPLAGSHPPAASADLIVHNAKIATVDGSFSIRQAMAVRGARIVAVGRDDDVLKLGGPDTRIVDLAGKLVLPGLIDSHAHPSGACVTEFDHPIPDFETIQDVLDYIRARARVLKEGEWIVLNQVFITRLRERRYPTRAELDAAAPDHPVLYRTGPDASVNSLALKLSGIDRNFKVKEGDPGFAEKDPATGEPTGILRRCSGYLKVKTTAKTPTEAESLQRQVELFKDYNSVGLTTVADRDCGAKSLARYVRLRDEGRLTVRIPVVLGFGSSGDIEKIQENIRRAAQHPLFKDKSGPVRVIGVKTYLDGGMLTGSAYMRQPWGISEIYSITDPAYRGVLFIPHDRLVPMIRAAVESDLQFTAHTVGDGAVHALLDAYEEVNRATPIRQSRPCISHSNFMSREAVAQAARLGVSLDIQPAWLYLDTRTLVAHFGYDRLRYFQPLRTCFELGAVAGGGSDHMQKIGSLRANNPYDPFLGIWTTITRKARWYDGQLHPEEALTREQAIRFYTRNNAHLLRLDEEVGSLEPGKRADFIVLDRDLLACPVDDIRGARVLRTYFDGKLVCERPN